MTTRGIQFLKSKQIRYTVVKYDHAAKGAEFAAQAVGFPLARTVKTLVVALDDNTFALVLMPGDRQLSLKKIAAACGAKRAAMADTASAQRLTGYLVGGISPFGTQKRLPVVMEASLEVLAEVMINAGRRGIMVKMAPADIIAVLDAKIVDLVQE
jgi:Cys-tRNA(Pro)/Cys-tRNA(Cys) deacylase